MNITKNEPVNYMIKYTPYFLVLYSLLGIFAYSFVDLPAAYFFLNIKWPPTIAKVFTSMNDIGRGSFYFIAFPILIIISWHFKKISLTRKLVFLFLCLIISGLCVDILKVILGRARPFEYDYYGFYWFKWNAYYWSFPSGHATVISSLMIGLAYLKPQRAILFMTLAVIMSSMRVILTNHYLSDVMGSFLISLTCVYYLHAFYLKKGYSL